MIPTFSIRFLFAATFFVAICAHYWHLAIGYSEPMVRQFTPSLLDLKQAKLESILGCFFGAVGIAPASLVA